MSNIKFTFKSNKKDILNELEVKKLLALANIGEMVSGWAAEDCPVDTGRLRNSITYVTHNRQGKANQHVGQPAKKEDYTPMGQPETDTVYIGTNVIYAAKQEYGDSFKHTSGKAHFLRDAAMNHQNKLIEATKNIMED